MEKSERASTSFLPSFLSLQALANTSLFVVTAHIVAVPAVAVALVVAAHIPVALLSGEEVVVLCVCV